jgi:peptidoglycan biosynthesis protein MviN/MurJ (putative lipid II flippase)
MSLSYPLYVYMGQRWSVLGLASASTLAITVYTVLLIYWLDRNFRGLGWRCGMFVLKVIPCIAAGILAGWLCRKYVHLELSIVRALVFGGAGLAIFWIAAGLAGLPEATEIPRRLLQRMQRRSS